MECKFFLWIPAWKKIISEKFDSAGNKTAASCVLFLQGEGNSPKLVRSAQKEEERMKKFLAGLVSLLMLSTAFAEPTITHLGYTAYLGSSNELYLQDPTGTVRVLRYPIADILSITDTVVYCRAQDGKLLSIALDGSQSLIIAEAPTDEQVYALTAKSSYTLTDGVLRNGATIVDTGVLAFCDLADEQTTTAPDELLYLKQNTTNTAALMVRTENVATARTLAILGITAPVLSMTANGENITIVASDHSVTVYNRVALTTTNYPATSELTEKASAIGSELFRYAPAESFGWNVEISAGLPAIEVVTDRGNVSVATATPAPATAVPTATARPTATVRPTATPRPTATATAASEYTRLNYGSKGKAVRKLQNRLSKLGYPVGKVDGVWGDDTQFAVNLFQSAIGYTEHRYASAAMQEKLYSKKAPVYDPYMPLKEGKKGTPVKLMQQRLFDLGYFTTNDVEKEVDGVYGKRTTEAIKLFQTVCGYEEKKITGVADADTLMLLFDEKAPVNPGNVPPTPTSPVVIITPTPTNVPTNEPTATPNLPAEPTEVPTATPAPTDVPTATPNLPAEPTEVPTATPAPTEAPTATPAPTDTVEVITPEPQPSETVTE